MFTVTVHAGYNLVLREYIMNNYVLYYSMKQIEAVSVFLQYQGI